jgi:hypothetical protein
MTAAAGSHDWRDRAACTQSDPELWYPTRGRSTAPGRLALKICNEECPVRVECLADELTHDAVHQHGIRGGKTAPQRKRMLRAAEVVPAIGAARRLRALACLGWSLADVSGWLEVAGIEITPRAICYIRSGQTENIDRDANNLIRVTYAALCRTASGKRFAVLARRKAAANGWPDPEAWADLDIDDPFASPHQAEPAAA